MAHCYSTMLREATRKVSSFYDEALLPVGINVAQFSMLRRIERLQPISLSELAREAYLDRSTIGRNVKVIERMGLVETRRSGVDQREALIMLTRAGTDMLETAGPVWDDCQAAMEKRLGAIKMTALQDILRSI
ncbi:DNA-binding MarR family transcriptional regulator [Rhizobium skierniewicense]|uniref:DNA-binding MarR family transcriptional regulator n=1 Tax=Rhizobium skierniewicense TaxID=984260 RepID=A0A7W6G0C4_9HYPH|nr:MarR family winged helix-turn-helix transcriptional regulator [Rhizobium skierniewicense]MBB3944254.1 DNA-binding MarR family transcriptional regulator [Rhizobium skierniewicense]